MDLDLSIHHICGLDELAAAPLATADRIVSIIGTQQPTPPELSGISTPVLTLRFDDVVAPIDDARPATEADIRAALQFDAGAREDERLVVHCTAGISRSTALLAVLLAARHPALNDEIFTAIRKIRPKAWPNMRVVMLGDDVLGRRGTLVAALRRHYAIQENNPAFHAST